MTVQSILEKANSVLFAAYSCVTIKFDGTLAVRGLPKARKTGD
jgi:hypothetical protein